MEILKQGDANRANQRMQFTCEHCGCVFVASKDEYREASQFESVHDNIRASCECPCCKYMTYFYW